MLKIETLSPKYYNFLFYLTFKGFFFHDFQVANLIFIWILILIWINKNYE